MQSHPQLVILVDPERRVEFPGLGEEIRPDRKIAAQQVGVGEAMPGPAHLLEHRLPPGQQFGPKKTALAFKQWGQVTDQDQVLLASLQAEVGLSCCDWADVVIQIGSSPGLLRRDFGRRLARRRCWASELQPAGKPAGDRGIVAAAILTTITS
jgi:hypothetical protein